jgi:hypothetical protein
MNQLSSAPVPRPKAIAALAIVNAVGFFLTLVFWLLVFVKKLVPPPNELAILSERVNAATTYGFGIGDLVWSLPLLFLAWIGLWRLRFWGWTAAQMTNALWIYSMTVILIRDAFTKLTPGSVIFTPFALIAIWAIGYLWKQRKLFREADGPVRASGEGKTFLVNKQTSGEGSEN